MPHHKQTPNKYERGIIIGVIVFASGMIICMPEKGKAYLTHDIQMLHIHRIVIIIGSR